MPFRWGPGPEVWDVGMGVPRREANAVSDGSRIVVTNVEGGAPPSTSHEATTPPDMNAVVDTAWAPVDVALVTFKRVGDAQTDGAGTIHRDGFV